MATDNVERCRDLLGIETLGAVIQNTALVTSIVALS